MIRKLLIIGGILVIIGISVGIYIYNKPHINLGHTRPDLVLSADSLVALYESDESRADSLLLGKVIEVSGTVADVVTNSDSTITVMLKTTKMGQVSCQLSEEASAGAKIVIGQEVVLRGSCSGMLIDVVLSNGALVQ